jgi:carboxylesterase type B
VVPKKVFDNAGKSKGAAVLVWIYGGGYTIGNKNGNGSPAGLIKRSLDHQGEGVIYVTLNYRLGAFGWLSGPTFQQDGTANAGLHDQRFALEWVQEHIAKFGGDPSRVTLFGESAGGGSTMHQITAYGGEKPVPFSQALPQSPGFPLLYTKTQQEHIFNDYLSILGVSTIEEARKMSFDQLQAANVKQVGASVYGWFVYGPAVDGDFVPALAGQLLQQGRFAKDLKVMVGHNTDEVSYDRLTFACQRVN